MIPQNWCLSCLRLLFSSSRPHPLLSTLTIMEYPSLVVAVEDLMSGLRFPHNVSARRDAAKRYGTYFPQKPDLSVWITPDDNYSTWEFNAPTSPLASKRPKYTADAPATLTPAQEIAYNYRRGSVTPTDSIDSPCSTPELATDDSCSSDDLSEAIDEKDPSVVERSLKIKYRQSRADELAQFVRR